MAVILNLESATEICSVSIAIDGVTQSIREASKSRSHTEKITVLIEECLRELGLYPNSLDAVAVSAGPGSYTSIRIGASTAKGLCYGLGVPLIALDTLAILAQRAVKIAKPSDIIVSMLDARRMEVYTANFDHKGERISKDVALVLESEMYNEQPSIIVGNATDKVAGFLGTDLATYLPAQASARYMERLSYAAFKVGSFTDVAYFDPKYMKPVRIIKSKKKLL